ncbi:unnamed protein product [Musa acuminata subsp. malaccensis]|uniref:(wild Malaysian banana) hypothetical protein n=1 Tax=Musa acuminata subsp. malaccensis TaxID=214687 RepID=A0A804HSC8_MUSAM|nr:unnamed protein product [Musa acuminata subsp. malaccensis]
MLHQITQEFKRTKGNLDSTSEHAELLDSVVISTSGTMSPRVNLLRERAAIQGSISHIDGVIGQSTIDKISFGITRDFTRRCSRKSEPAW